MWVGGYVRGNQTYFFSISNLSATHCGFKFKILNPSASIKLHTIDEFLHVGLGEFIDS